MKLDILVFAAHPDDAELSCSGTIMRHLDLGYKVGIVDLTRGEMGTRGTPELRQKEAEASSKIMGISIRENLGFEDCFFTKDKAHLISVIEMIRKYQPELVLCNAASDRHIDHGKGSDLVNDACFLSGLRKIETKIAGKPQISWRPKQVYNYIQDRITKPDLVFDITPYFEKKMECILAFESQFFNPESMEPLTPISSPEFMKHLKGRALEYGRQIGVTFGEGFTVKRNIGAKNLFDLI
ncbi:MAG: bacillithiol biosynthesis deacetylase BshB1 [Bacteroidota bacterium]|nr:bacillithiol biosynthesis deacetylase BshB1 [Bacteroidota bacterium]